MSEVLPPAPGSQCSLSSCGDETSRGISILELLVAVSVLIVICATSISLTSEIFTVRALRQTTTNLLRLLDTAAIRATAGNQDLVLRYDHTTHAVQVLERRAKANGQVQNIATSILPLPKAVRLSFPTTVRRAEVQLFSSGVTTPITITLTAKHGQQCKIVQALRGLRRKECTTV